MKRIVLPLFAVLALCLSCKEKPVDYIAKVQDSIDAFSATYKSVAADTELSDAQKEEKLYAEYDLLTKNVGEITQEALSIHNNDSVAVFMVITMAQMEITDAEGLLKAINNLGPEAQADPDIAQLKYSIEKKQASAVGTQFLDFNVQQPDGSNLSLSDFAGKGKCCLVDFWASWCAPCKAEIKNLKEINRKYGKKITMLSIAVWDDPQSSIDTAKAYGISWNQIVGAGQYPTELYGIQGIPHIMLIGPDGTILARDLRGGAIEEALAEYVK